MTQARRTWRAHALVLATLFVFSACQSAPPSTASPAATATASPAVTPQPSPTTAAINVVPLFAAAMNSLSSGVVGLDGNATVGNVKVTISGTSTFDGPDSKGSITTTVGGVSTVVETVKVAGKAYAKQGDGPWLASSTPTNTGLSESLKGSAASSFTDKGTQTRAGRTVHQLVAGGGSAFDPSVFLGSATGVSDVTGTTTFYCSDDGAPVAATIELNWKQAAGAQTLDASMTFEIEFSALGSAQTITAPEDVWVRMNIDKRGYSIAHPADYDYTAKQGYDYFIGPADAFYFGSRTDTQGFGLNTIAKSEINSIKSSLKARAVTNEDVRVGGIAGRLLSATGTNADLGGKVVLYEAIVVKGKFAYFIAWVSGVGKAEADLAMFRQVISTFQFLG